MWSQAKYFTLLLNNLFHLAPIPYFFADTLSWRTKYLAHSVIFPSVLRLSANPLQFSVHTLTLAHEILCNIMLFSL